MDDLSCIDIRVRRSKFAAASLSKLPMKFLEKIFDAACDAPYEEASPSASSLSTTATSGAPSKSTATSNSSRSATLSKRGALLAEIVAPQMSSTSSPPAPRTTQLRRLVDTLPNLVGLVINDDSEKFLDVLLPPNRQTVFPFMPTIKSVVCFCRTQRADPYNPAYLASLTSMTSLSSLELVFLVNEPANAQPVLRPPEHFSVAPLNSLSDMVMNGAAVQGLTLFLQQVTSVRALPIKHYRDPPSPSA
ncbi:hypothetical protein JCM10295v2_002685 [Rhodotorula toruloides]